MIPTNTTTKIVAAKRPPSTLDASIVFVFEGEKSPPQSAQRLFTAKLIKTKPRDITTDLLDGGVRLLVVGLGPAEKVTTEILRQAAGAAAKFLLAQNLAAASLAVPAVPQISPASVAEALATGILLASFKFTEYKGSASKPDEIPKSLTVTFTGDPIAPITAGVDRARIICEAQNFTRTIASRPGNDINPPSLAAAARALAKSSGLTIRIMDEHELKRLGMGGLLGVGSGSIKTPPRLIILEHKPAAAKKSRPLLLVGKSITFDTGGISIKPADKMGKMIFDKSGGCAVLGAMRAISSLKIPVHVVGILAAAENAVSENAYRPGDILKMFNGVTVEVTNTDAEGRLVLGDALAWGIETYNPAAVVDLATLTGGVVVALGKATAGVMANNDSLVAELVKAGEEAGEKIWRLPLWDEHRDLMKSDCADILNAGPREASPLQGGAFLSYFVPRDGDKTPWAHLDIAGVADTEKDLPYYARGSTGWGVRTLVNWITARSGIHRNETKSR